MDFVDAKLEKYCCFKLVMQKGQIVMCNNHLIAHMREPFKDQPGALPRHKVRAWAQVQQAHLVSEEDGAQDLVREIMTSSKAAAERRQQQVGLAALYASMVGCEAVHPPGRPFTRRHTAAINVPNSIAKMAYGSSAL